MQVIAAGGMVLNRIQTILCQITKRIGGIDITQSSHALRQIFTVPKLTAGDVRLTAHRPQTPAFKTNHRP